MHAHTHIQIPGRAPCPGPCIHTNTHTHWYLVGLLAQTHEEVVGLDISVDKALRVHELNSTDPSHTNMPHHTHSSQKIHPRHPAFRQQLMSLTSRSLSVSPPPLIRTTIQTTRCSTTRGLATPKIETGTTHNATSLPTCTLQSKELSGT